MLVAAYGGKVEKGYRHALNGYAAEMTEDEALALSEDPRVQFVEEDQVYTADATQTGATWGLDRIGQRDRPLNGTYVYNWTGSGVTFVVAAGNGNANACNYSPARAAAAVTVGSTTSSDARSSFSNYGTCVDIFAPGSSITSAWHASTTATNRLTGIGTGSPNRLLYWLVF